MSAAPPSRAPLSLVVVALWLAAVVVLLPFTVPIVLAAWVSLLGRPLLAVLERALRGRHVAAGVLTTVLVVVVVGLLGSATAVLVLAADQLLAQLRDAIQGGSLGPLPPLRAATPTVEGIADLVRHEGAGAVRLLAGTLRGSLRVLAATVVFFSGVYSLSVHGPGVRMWLERSLPIPARAFERFATAFAETGRGLVVGVGLTALVQGLLATVAYAALGVPRAPVLGFLTSVAALVPGVGTGIVWAPLAVALAVSGEPVRGVVLALVGFFVISLVDNVLRPVLARYGRLQLGTFVLFLSILGGLLTLGAAGLVLGPLAVRMAVEAAAIAHEEGLFRRARA